MPHPGSSQATVLGDYVLDASGWIDEVLAVPNAAPSEPAPLVPLPREEWAQAAGEARRRAAAVRAWHRQQ